MLVLKLTNQEITSAMSEKEILGKGGYGTVYRGYMRSTRVAIKCLNEVRLNDSNIIAHFCNSILSGWSKGNHLQ